MRVLGQKAGARDDVIQEVFDGFRAKVARGACRIPSIDIERDGEVHGCGFAESVQLAVEPLHPAVAVAADGRAHPLGTTGLCALDDRVNPI